MAVCESIQFIVTGQLFYYYYEYYGFCCTPVQYATHHIHLHMYSPIWYYIHSDGCNIKVAANLILLMILKWTLSDV